MKISHFSIFNVHYFEYGVSTVDYYNLFITTPMCQKRRHRVPDSSCHFVYGNRTWHSLFRVVLTTELVEFGKYGVRVYQRLGFPPAEMALFGNLS
jgi:hypothetical protein